MARAESPLPGGGPALAMPAEVTPATLRCALDVMRPTLSLEHLRAADPSDDEDEPTAAIDVADPREAVTPEADVAGPATGPVAAALLDGVASPRTRLILELRFGFAGPPLTRREVARRLGLTAERVRQLEVQALATLRAAATGGVASAAPSSAA